MESEISVDRLENSLAGQAPESAAQIQENHNLAVSEKATFYRSLPGQFRGGLRERWSLLHIIGGNFFMEVRARTS